MVNGTTAATGLSWTGDEDEVDEKEEEEVDEEKSPLSTSCRTGSHPTLFHVVQAATPPSAFRVRNSSRAPCAGSGKAKSARDVKERSNVQAG